MWQLECAKPQTLYSNMSSQLMYPCIHQPPRVVGVLSFPVPTLGECLSSTGEPRVASPKDDYIPTAGSLNIPVSSFSVSFSQCHTTLVLVFFIFLATLSTHLFFISHRLTHFSFQHIQWNQILRIWLKHLAFQVKPHMLNRPSEKRQGVI